MAWWGWVLTGCGIGVLLVLGFWVYLRFFAPGNELGNSQYAPAACKCGHGPEKHYYGVGECMDKTCLCMMYEEKHE
jgi:hypothetical protein